MLSNLSSLANRTCTLHTTDGLEIWYIYVRTYKVHVVCIRTPLVARVHRNTDIHFSVTASRFAHSCFPTTYEFFLVVAIVTVTEQRSSYCRCCASSKALGAPKGQGGGAVSVPPVHDRTNPVGERAVAVAQWKTARVPPRRGLRARQRAVFRPLPLVRGGLVVQAQPEDSSSVVAGVVR